LLKLSCIQGNFDLTSHETEEKVFYFLDLSKENSDLIILPEYAAGVFDLRFLKEGKDFILEKNRVFLTKVRVWCKKNKKHVCIGSIIHPEGEHIFNRSLVIDDKGEVVSFYDKIHLFDAKLGEKEAHSESSFFKNGTAPVYWDSYWGKIGLTICYDLRFPNLYRSLAKSGCNLIIVSAAFTDITIAHWEILLRARAIENYCFIAGCNQTGQYINGKKTGGKSAIVSPWGEDLACIEEEEGVIFSNIDFSYSNACREKIPSLYSED